MDARIHTNTVTELKLETLEGREVPSTTLSTVIPVDVPQTPAAHPHRFAVASGAGETGIVSVYERGTNALLTTITPFNNAYTAGLRVATGDITGDGVDDLIVASAVGGGEIKVYDGANWKMIADFTAYSPTSRGGAYIALGDVNGDGKLDIVTGAGAGNRPLVRIYDGSDVLASATKTQPKIAASFFAYDFNYMGGVRVAAGNLHGTKTSDIITAPGAGLAPTVRIFNTVAPWGTGIGTYRNTTTDILVGGANDKGGVYVAANDINGDGKADIVVGRQVGANACVTVYDVSSTAPKTLLTAFGFNNTGGAGIPVAAVDINGTGKASILASGGDGTSQVRVLNSQGGLARSFMAFTPSYQGGVFVG